MISVAIMAHRKRERWVPDLIEQLEPCEVVWDRHNDRHETGLRSLQAADPEASHHLVIQDDAILSRHLRAGVEKLVELTGEHPVGLYMGNVGPQAAILRAMIRSLTPRFVAGEGPHWGVGIVIPTVHLPELTAWYQKQATPNYDRRISRWYLREQISCWYTAPSLVEHRHEDNPSLVQGRNGGRQAAWFIGSERSAADIEWDVEPWVPPLAPKVVCFVGPGQRIVKLREGSLRWERYKAHSQWIEKE